MKHVSWERIKSIIQIKYCGRMKMGPEIIMYLNKGEFANIPTFLKKLQIYPNNFTATSNIFLPSN